MAGRYTWAPLCGAKTRACGDCSARVAIGPDGRPRSRCRMHGGHLKSGKQTPEGRKRISEAMRKRMLAFWNAWRKQGKPPLLWRESLRTARARPQRPPPAPRKQFGRPVILSEADRAFARLIGMKLPKPRQNAKAREDKISRKIPNKRVILLSVILCEVSREAARFSCHFVASIAASSDADQDGG